ncbi:ExbD/TolR family protein [Eikenella corrodens]|uniref:ExbD/TolR family protein n=1 Tax=Eikenella corrodens TaxID=539 RepID=UPI00129AE0BE|nr:biopolymer transporter ExbD [Eikenella corrodens]
MAFGSMNSGDDSPMADINVTPLVDVMLVLLIVFMITMPVMTHSIPLELPTASAKQVAENAAQPKDPLRISISADGSYHLAEGESITLQALESQLQQLAKTNPDQVIAIAADKNAQFDYVEKALSAVRDAGLSKVGFVTEEKERTQPQQ